MTSHPSDPGVPPADPSTRTNDSGPGRPGRSWPAALAAGVLAAALTGAVGEAAVNTFAPETFGDPSGGPMTGGIAPGGLERALEKNAALTAGLQGAILGALFGVAGAVAVRDPRRAVLAAPAGIVLGGALGVVATFCLARVVSRLDMAPGNDLVVGLLAHAGSWGALGAGAGFAFALGVGGGASRLARGAMGGLIGAAIGAAVYEVVGALLFPQGGTAQPLADARPARLLAHAAVDLLAALGAGVMVAVERPYPPR